MTHVDDFIDSFGPCSDGERYAKWFFALFRFPAALKLSFAPFLAQYKLFATWQGKRYRVTGCSRLGDVWLSADFARDCGYEHRIDLDECSEWSKEP